MLLRKQPCRRTNAAAETTLRPRREAALDFASHDPQTESAASHCPLMPLHETPDGPTLPHSKPTWYIRNKLLSPR